MLQELTEGFSSGREAAGNGDTRCRQIADHFTQGSILATNVFYVVLPEVLKPDYIFRQGCLLKYVKPVKS